MAVQHCYTRLRAGFRLNNFFSIVDNIEQCGQHNIVQSCFQQPSTTRNFYARKDESNLEKPVSYPVLKSISADVNIIF